MPYRDIVPARMSSEVENMLIKLQGFRLRALDAETVEGIPSTTNTYYLVQKFEAAEESLLVLREGIAAFSDSVDFDFLVPHALSVYIIRSGLTVYSREGYLRIIACQKRVCAPRGDRLVSASFEDLYSGLLHRDFCVQLRHNGSLLETTNFGHELHISPEIYRKATDKSPLELVLVQSTETEDGKKLVFEVARRSFSKEEIDNAE